MQARAMDDDDDRRNWELVGSWEMGSGKLGTGSWFPPPVFFPAPAQSARRLASRRPRLPHLATLNLKPVAESPRPPRPARPGRSRSPRTPGRTVPRPISPFPRPRPGAACARAAFQMAVRHNLARRWVSCPIVRAGGAAGCSWGAPPLAGFGGRPWGGAWLRGLEGNGCRGRISGLRLRGDVASCRPGSLGRPRRVGPLTWNGRRAGGRLEHFFDRLGN